jgi:phosphoenolpyruvate synthase/pyruvate phosphate dikinase
VRSGPLRACPCLRCRPHPTRTPLFLAASSVVCDTGANLSHAAIVARELGIPAVMRVPGITAVEDGTLLHIDGDRGVVTLV